MNERSPVAGQRQETGVIVRRAWARLLRNLPASSGTSNGRTYHPRTYPKFAPATIWKMDQAYDRAADAEAFDQFAITNNSTSANSTVTVASSDATIFKQYDPFVIIGSSGAINDRQGRCTADATIQSGVMTITTNLTLASVADRGTIIRLVPPPLLLGRVIMVANRWHDAEIESGTIVRVEQEDGSEWWALASSGCGPLETP